MNYILNVDSEVYPVEELRIPTDVTRAQLVGRPLYFVSPVRLTVGSQCSLTAGEGAYQLVVSGCFGFSYSLKFLVSGTIASTQSIAA